MKEGIDYHIKPMGKGFELSAQILTGYVAGVVDLTKRGYKINYNMPMNIGGLYIANTIPKAPKPKKTVKKAEKPKDNEAEKPKKD